jgi:nicotinamidase-related amidase
MTAFPGDMKVSRSRAALLVVDVQERLFAAMPEEGGAQLVKNAGILIELARRLGIPIVWSEQYPKGLGPTVPALAQPLAAMPDVLRLEKLEFGCTDAPGWPAIWDRLRRDQWIVCGMESHVCVYQSVRGLTERQATVHVPADAVLSRTHENWEIGLSLCERAGAVVTSTEVVVFDSLERAGSEDFKAMSKLVK